ncbi:hypothetical protein LSTR_LSTR002515 [Laodelphax striatellus]|uniref:Uncharacterized protein n=1 Tax=Laodelphax striatellus TaxID=195883 RepID=A0A482X371_LAOST|nr:hypothetical protein LSTR_LSTR002515 [Laodelphax striatellus]
MTIIAVRFDAPIVIDAASGPVNVEVKKPMDYFNRYLDTAFFTELAEFTNKRSVEEMGKSLDSSTREMCKFWGPVLLLHCCSIQD